MKLQGKIALVTGAGSDIGQAVTLLFTREGARVIAVDKSTEWLQKRLRDLAELDRLVEALPLDVTDEAMVKTGGSRRKRIGINRKGIKRLVKLMEAVKGILVVQRTSLLISTRFAWKLPILRFFTQEDGGKRLLIQQGEAFPLVFGRLLRKPLLIPH
jgi:NAD(P)-dependent dehydrogenase (short-subunit alcohol dehydrogenase family)